MHLKCLLVTVLYAEAPKTLALSRSLGYEYIKLGTHFFAQLVLHDSICKLECSYILWCSNLSHIQNNLRANLQFAWFQIIPDNLHTLICPFS